MGLTGSLHCAGMCGAIMWVVPFHKIIGWSKILALLAYHFFRITVYVLMGLLLFQFKDLFNPQVQQIISVILGSILLLLGVITFFPGSLGKIMKHPWSSFVQSGLSKVACQPNLLAVSIAGLLNGLLPCGLVYMALSASIALDYRWEVAAFIYSFGIGTTPMLLAITIFRSKVSYALNGTVKKLVPLFVFAFGLLFVLRGLNLGIPYLSPKVHMSGQRIDAECCHK